MKSVSDYSYMVEESIAGLGYGTATPANLYLPIEYGLQKGGKRIRPVLTLMGAEAFGTTAQKALIPATGIEMFHNFTLLHDDVMDRSDLRRGRPTVHKKWDENTAILSGDTMLTLATQMVSTVPDVVLRRVLDTFNRMAIAVYEGQCLDMDFEQMDVVSVESYLDMIGKKTGALLGAAAAIGAIIAGASEKDCALMEQYGYMLGLAFQIQDDWLDMFGDPATFGKPIGGDVLNRKKTFLTVSVMERGGAEAQALHDAMNISDGELRIKIVRKIYEQAGIPDLCRENIEFYSHKALRAIRSTGMAEEGQRSFEKLVEKLIDRRR